ncbi:MAG: hypothetical protein M3033_11390 [Acidobacteriota bacterium]|nr:hypothetical protein [Acidobacteriota bacterium]
MNEKKTTTISRSWSATIGYLIGGVVLLGVSALLFMTIVGGAVTFGIALIPAIVALMLLYASFGGAGTSACPGCGAALSGLSTKSNDGVLCSSCHRYAEGQNGSLWLTDENRIADEPIFSSPLPEQFAFPPSCCVCGNAETRRETISFTTQNASSAITAPTIGVRTDTKISVEVPHCAEHKDGASLSATPRSSLIRFRSYPYLRAFCRLNGTNPG